MTTCEWCGSGFDPGEDDEDATVCDPCLDIDFRTQDDGALWTGQGEVRLPVGVVDLSTRYLVAGPMLSIRTSSLRIATMYADAHGAVTYDLADFV